MSFKKGTVFRVLDTMPDGNMGHWYAIRLDRTNQPAERGIVPNNNRWVKKRRVGMYLKGLSEMSKPNNFLYIHFQIEDKHE